MPILIEKLVFGGDGFGRDADGRPIFVSKAVPGDLLEVEIIKEKKSYCRGKIKKIISAGTDRITPSCKYFENCGGCDHQNISYINQLKYKDKIFQEVLDRAKIKIRPEKIIPGSNQPLFYRNSIRFMSVIDKNNQIAFARHSDSEKENIPVDFCQLQSKKSNLILENLRKYINRNVEDKSAFWQLKVREGKRTGDVMIEIITSAHVLPAEKGIVETLKKMDGVKSIYHTIAPAKSLLKLKRRLIFGSPVIYEKIGSFTFQISPESFFQTNSLGVKTLYDKIKVFADVKFGDEVLDLFCGTGTIGIYLSTLAKKVTGVDVVPGAIRDANDNAKLNHIKNIEFICSDVNNITVKQFSNCVLVVDPPRAGLKKELIDKISEIDFKKIIYVSCNPATFVRDLKYFAEYNIYANKIQPIDMFPQTHHIEIVAKLEKHS